MAIIGAPRVYHQKFRFVVEIDNINAGSFQSCTELAGEFAEVTQYEGGALIPHKAPGRITYDDITLARGATNSLELYAWWKLVGGGAGGAGALPEPAFRRNLDIVQLSREGTEARRWRVYGAWPKRFVAGDWDNDSDENVIEQLVLAYDYFDLPGAAAAGALAGLLGRV